MHTTLREIAALVRTLELPSPINYPEAESFFEDDSLADTTIQLDDSNPPRYYQGRKITNSYPTPPLTPPPAAFLAEGRPRNPKYTSHGYSRTIP
jgi:hypothetical protein